MCGRYYIESEEDIIGIREVIREVQEKLYGRPEAAQLKQGEIYPTNIVPIISASGPEAMQWGYPRWGASGVVINARSETVRDKSMFRRSLVERRCVVPTTGFYEWRHEGGKSKEKYLFTLSGEKILYLAAIYNVFEGDPLPRFTILTTAANDSMLPYHDRMPVLLGAEERGQWISDGSAADGILHRVPAQLVAQRTEKPQPQQMSLLNEH